MEKIKIATIGVENKDLTALRSLLNIVAGSMGGWEDVETSSKAHITFVGGIAPDRVNSVIEKFGADAFLVFCVHTGEVLPPDVYTLHRPLRPAELTKVLEIASKRELP